MQFEKIYILVNLLSFPQVFGLNISHIFSKKKTPKSSHPQTPFPFPFPPPFRHPDWETPTLRSIHSPMALVHKVESKRHENFALESMDSHGGVLCFFRRGFGEPVVDLLRFGFMADFLGGQNVKQKDVVFF